MALAQFASKRLRRVAASVREVYRRGSVHDGRIPDPCAQVHPELLQRVSVQFVRRPALRNENGGDAVRGAPIGDFHESSEDSRRVYV